MMIYEQYEIYNLDTRYFIIFLLSIPLTILILCIFWFLHFSQTSEHQFKSDKTGVQILFLALVLALRLIICFHTDFISLQKLDSFTEDSKQIQVQILDISRSRGDIQEVIFKYNDLNVIGYIDWFKDFQIKDLCNIYASIEKPENFEDFNYIGYLKNKNIYLKSSRIDVIDCSNNFSVRNPSDIYLLIKRNLMILREKLSKHVEKYLPEPQASLLIGVLFGSEKAFSKGFEESLRISGTTHIIAASGYNITILILASNKTLYFIKKKYRLIISLFLIWIYCILSGLGASILRATVMGTITIFAFLSGNVRNTHLLIPTGILFLILINPKILFDIGFQLSILATLGLIYILPSIEGAIEKIFNIKSVPQLLEDNLLGTISCTLSTLPISISIFKKVSLVSVFANMFVLPLTESTMLYGTVALIVSSVLNSLGPIAFSLPYIQLKLFEYIVEFFGSIKWGYIDVKKSWSGWMIGIFLFIFSIYFYPLEKENYYAKRLKDI